MKILGGTSLQLQQPFFRKLTFFFSVELIEINVLGADKMFGLTFFSATHAHELYYLMHPF